MKTSKLITIALMVLITITINAQRANRFTGSKPPGAPVRISSNNWADKTRDLRLAINSFGNSGGNIELSGKITLRKVYLKSNIHINIKKGTIIKLGNTGTNMFDLGKRGQDGRIQNVRFYCDDCNNKFEDNANAAERYTIDISSRAPGANANVWAVGNVKNFSISHFIVKDNYTKVNALSYDPVVEIPAGNKPLYEKDIKVLGAPRDGDLKYGHIINGSSGYGLVQTQAGKNLNFHHLSAIGGVVLRLESGAFIANIPTDAEPMADLDNIEGYNLKCKDGYSSVLLSPHGRSQGTVTLENISSVGCNTNVLAATGFQDRDLSALTDFPNDKFKRGTFREVILKGNISHTYGTKAQTERKYFAYYPDCIRNGKTFDQKFSHSRHTAPYTDQTDQAKINAPSMTNVLYRARRSATAAIRKAQGEYRIKFNTANFITRGFNSGVKNVTYHGDRNGITCSGSVASMQEPIEPIALSTLSAEEENKLHVDASSKTLHASVATSVVVYVFDISGRLVKTAQVNAGNDMIGLSDLHNGIYFAKFELNGKAYSTKFYIK